MTDPGMFRSWRAAFVVLGLACVVNGILLGLLVLAFTAMVGVP